MSPEAFIRELWSYAEEVPMVQHPWFEGILQHRWTREQIILGEVQHYLRVRTNPIHWGYIMVNAVDEKRYELIDVVMENFMEELSTPRSHVDVMLQFLEEGGISRDEADRTDPAPGTMAAIEMITGCCQRRSALEGLAMLSFVEAQHGGAEGVAAKVYRELVGFYGFSERAAETYSLHAEQDAGHGGRQIEAIRRYATDQETQEKVRQVGGDGLYLGVGWTCPGDDRPASILERRRTPQVKATSRQSSRRTAPVTGSPFDFTLQRPLLREGSTEFLVLRIFATIPLQTVQHVQKFLEFHIKAVRDHARGLLEVTPSVPASAEHPLHDVTLVFIHSHGILPDRRLDSPLCRHKGACSGEAASHHLIGGLLRRRELTGPWRGKPNGLGGDYFSAILRHTVLIEDHPQPCKYPPWLFPPQYTQDQKSVLHHRACWLTAGDCKRKASTLTR
jgi:pyrroloquinoline quinone (PQQ) biosynthesis protein C